MAKIQAQFVLYSPEGRLTVVDSRGRVWVYYDDASHPEDWVQVTELPQVPPSDPSQNANRIHV